MQKFQNWLSGKKTFIVAILMVLIGVVNFLTGDVTLSEFLKTEEIKIVMEGIGLATLRLGVGKANKK